MGTNEINSANFSQNNVEGTKDKKLSKEEKAKLEKQKNNKEIQNYYKKAETPSDTININEIDAKKAELENKSKDLKKYNETKEQTIKEQFSKNSEEQLDKLKQMDKELELKKQKIEKKLQQTEEELVTSKETKFEKFLKKEIENIHYEMNNCLKKGDIEGAENKEKRLNEMKTKLESIEAIKQFYEESSKNKTNEKDTHYGFLN